MQRPTGQVIAPFLIIRRVANKSAFTRDTVVSGRTGSLKFWKRGNLTGCSGPHPSGDPTVSVDEYEMNSSKLTVGAESMIDFDQGKT